VQSALRLGRRAETGRAASPHLAKTGFVASMLRETRIHAGTGIGAEGIVTAGVSDCGRV